LEALNGFFLGLFLSLGCLGLLGFVLYSIFKFIILKYFNLPHMVSETEMNFNLWIQEVDAFSTRSEKVYKDILQFKYREDADNLETIINWLKNAYKAGHEEGQNTK
jgi:predicted patatin/cPLA2 family phospholipase